MDSAHPPGYLVSYRPTGASGCGGGAASGPPRRRITDFGHPDQHETDVIMTKIREKCRGGLLSGPRPAR